MASEQPRDAAEPVRRPRQGLAEAFQLESDLGDAVVGQFARDQGHRTEAHAVADFDRVLEALRKMLGQGQRRILRADRQRVELGDVAETYVGIEAELAE